MTARAVGAGLAIAVIASSTSTAQPRTRVAGTVVRTVGGGTAPVAEARVVLHRVGRATQGPLDSTVTGTTGRFQFLFEADTTANYLLSTRFAGIEYFSNPVATNPARPDTAVEVRVSDTSSSAPVEVRTRTFVVSLPDAVGSRTVIDWLVIRNPGITTRVGSDTLSPTWAAELPIGARNAQVGDPRLSQFSPDAIEFRGDSVYLSAPIAPGDKELLLQYEIPAVQREFAVFLAGADSVEVFLEETTISVPRRGWAVSDSNAFEGRRFRRLSRIDQSVDRLELRFPGWGIAPEGILVWLVAGFLVAMASLSWRLLRSPPPERAGSGATAIALADQIARLDRAAASDGSADDPGTRTRRAELVAQLEAALARRGG